MRPIDGEDRRFCTHGGVDIPSVIRAAIGQVSGADGSGGASTLSMQLVRNTLVLRALNNDGLAGREAPRRGRRRPSTPTSTASSRR